MRPTVLIGGSGSDCVDRPGAQGHLYAPEGSLTGGSNWPSLPGPPVTPGNSPGSVGAGKTRRSLWPGTPKVQEMFDPSGVALECVAPDCGRVGGALGWRSVAAPLWAGSALALLGLLLSGLSVCTVAGSPSPILTRRQRRDELSRIFSGCWARKAWTLDFGSSWALGTRRLSTRRQRRAELSRIVREPFLWESISQKFSTEMATVSCGKLYAVIRRITSRRTRCRGGSSQAA